MKKGFTLVETVVALAVIVVISFAFFSMATFASINLEKSCIKNYGIIEMQGITNVFNVTDFEISGQFSVLNFQENLAFCGYELKDENQDFTFSKRINQNGESDVSGKGLYQFWVSKNHDFVTLTGKILYQDKLLYEMPELKKVVNL